MHTMIRTVEVYQAPDGRQFNTALAAERHAKDMLCVKLEALINRIFPNVGHRPSVIQAVEILADQPRQTKAQLGELLDMLAYGDEE